MLRKSLLVFEFVYNLINLFFNWFGIAFFYLTFYYLMATVIPPSSTQSNGSNIGDVCSKLENCYYVFDALQSIYVGAIVSVFICSMGNRPQGSKSVYTFIMVVFALIMSFMIFFGAYSIYKILTEVFAIPNQSIVSLFKTSSQFRDLVLTSAATWGLYLVSSVLYMDPWHMITSFIPYLVLLPSFTNILSIYAFCNLHDVSWGTKGDNGAQVLGSVTSKIGIDGSSEVQVDFPQDLQEIDYNYNIFVTRLGKPREKNIGKVDKSTAQQDYFKGFRTQVILSWMLCNAIVVALMTNQVILNQLQSTFTINTASAATARLNPFLAFIFYSILGLSFVRFVGSTSYIVNRIFRG